MKIVLRAKQAGKTTQLILMSAKIGAYIVCPSLSECSRIFAQANEMGLQIPFPISFSEFLGRQYYGKGIKHGFLIDNADLLLQALAGGVEVKGFSVTLEEDSLDAGVS